MNFKDYQNMSDEDLLTDTNQNGKEPVNEMRVIFKFFDGHVKSMMHNDGVKDHPMNSLRYEFVRTVEVIHAVMLNFKDMHQNRMHEWMLKCFGSEISANKKERNFRFLEEALELVQAAGCSKEDAIALVDYVYDRPTGEVEVEVGNVMVTLAAFCNAHGFSMNDCMVKELERINDPAMTDKIRKKHAAKKIKEGPLP